MSQLTLQLPDPLLDAVRKVAAREHTTVEALLTRVMNEFVRQDAEWEQRVERGRKVSRERFIEILNKAPDVPPMPGDEIE